jgi:hypothetical protein
MDPKKKWKIFLFLAKNSKKNAKNLKNLPNFQNHKIGEKKEGENPSECMRSSLFLLAKSSQKAMLKKLKILK